MLPRFTLGDTLQFSKSLAAYPASAGWVLHYRLLKRTGSGDAITFNSAASGDAHAFDVAPATTAAWTAGTYSWSSWVTDGADSFTVEQGTTELLPNPRTVTAPLDVRSETQIALDNVRAALRGKASADVLRYTINGRQLERYSVGELMKLESKLVLDLKVEQGRPRKIFGAVARA